MKTIMFVAAALLFGSAAFSQDVLYFEDFESGGGSFSLNTTDVGSTTSGANTWLMNDEYTGGTGDLICLGFPFSYTIVNTPSQPGGVNNNPNSTYLHTISQEAINDGITCSSFAAADGLCIFADNVFSRMNVDLDTQGYDEVELSFWWACGGGSTFYGEVYYSTNSGGSWTQITTPISQYNNTGVWTQQTITLPAFSNQSSLRFGFRFVNQSGGISATDPGFSLDDIQVTGTASFTTLPTAETTWCQGDFYSVEYSSSTTFSAGNIFEVELSDEFGSFAAPTLIGFAASTAPAGSILCLVPTGQTPGTGYRVRVTSSSPVQIAGDNGEDIEILDCDAIPGCIDSTACNYDSEATIDDGTCTYPGCTSPGACNYDSTAACDDGSCDFVSCIGCLDSEADNYDATATIDCSDCCCYLDTETICGLGTVWDEDLGQCIIFCQPDLDFNGIVNTADLLTFLISFGITCE